MPCVNYAECPKLAIHAECQYAECHYAECRGATYHSYDKPINTWLEEAKKVAGRLLLTPGVNVQKRFSSPMML
jgi:hypothetical protein